MRVTAPQLRTVLLAQAIEQVDSGRTLVSPPELEDATRSAVASALSWEIFWVSTSSWIAWRTSGARSRLAPWRSRQPCSRSACSAATDRGCARAGHGAGACHHPSR